MTLIKQRLQVDPILTPGKTGQFDVLADGQTIATRGGNWFTQKFGAGYPDLDPVVQKIEQRSADAGTTARRGT